MRIGLFLVGNLGIFAGPSPTSRDCILSHDLNSYSGTLATTENGTTCQRWKSSTPHSPSDQIKDLDKI